MRLFDAVRSALDTIRLATAEIRARHTPRTLTLSTDFGFATYWLMPRLSQFKALMPDVDVRIITSQDGVRPIARPCGYRDRVRRCERRLGRARNGEALRRAKSRRCAARRFAAAHAGVGLDRRSASNLPLLHLEPTTPERWLSWDGWFAAHGLARAAAHRGITFNSFAFVAHAAVMGQGVALGWAPLVDELIATGQLVRLFDAPVVTERGYVLVTPRTPSPAVRAFRPVAARRMRRRRQRMNGPDAQA